ncbi:hypothetical protein [Bradyrhizobium brasilense]|nr:hypothetical protein [Bradyrhizobium brasilense]
MAYLIIQRLAVASTSVIYLSGTAVETRIVVAALSSGCSMPL